MTALPAIRLPDIDPTTLERPAVALPDGLPSLGDAITGAAEAVGLRKPRRSPWPFALVGLMVAGATWIVMTNQGLRMRLGELARGAREGIASWQRRAFGPMTSDDTEPVAFTAAETRPIPPERWSETDDRTPDYPEGLGSNASSNPEETALGV